MPATEHGPVISGSHARRTRSNVPSPQGIIAIDKVGNAIRFYDAATLAETGAIEGPEPCVHELALTPDRRTAFVPLYGDGIYGSNRNPNNKVLVIDLERREIASVIELGRYRAPHGMVALSDGSLWVTSDLDGVLLHVDPVRGTVADASTCPGRGPHLVAALPDESKLYVSCKEGPVCVFDRAQSAFTATVPIGDPAVADGNGSGCEGLAFAPDGARLVVADNAGSALHVVDTRLDEETDRIALAGHPPTNVRRSRLVRPLFSPDSRYLVVASYATGLCWIIDGDDLARQTIVPVAKGPMGILFEPGGETVLVTSHDSGLITRVALANGRILGAFDGGAGIEVLAYF